MNRNSNKAKFKENSIEGYTFYDANIIYRWSSIIP